MSGRPKRYAKWRRQRLLDLRWAEFNRKLQIIGKAIDEGRNPDLALALDVIARAGEGTK